MTTEQASGLCQTIKRLGYGQNSQVRLYGQTFDLLSDPFTIGDNLVFVDALERKSGRPTRVRIPLNIVQTAKAAQKYQDAA